MSVELNQTDQRRRRRLRRPVEGRIVGGAAAPKLYMSQREEQTR